MTILELFIVFPPPLYRIKLKENPVAFANVPRLGYATSYETLMVQISQDGGQSWQTVFSEAGTDNSGQTVFSTHTISLADFADSAIRVRFLYDFVGGSRYFCTESYCGVLVDDIQLLNSREVIDSTIIQLTEQLGFPFSRDSGNPYALAIKAVPWIGYSGLDWGPLFYLPAIPEKIALNDAVDILIALGAGSQDDTLTDVIAILRVLTGY